MGMKPRPSAKTIIAKTSKHDEFVALFGRQLNLRKQSQIENEPKTAKKKRKSVPDFAMLSEINSELDLAAHTLRLQTLREDKQMKAQNEEIDDEKTLSPITGSSSSSPTADSQTVFKEKLLNENDGM